MKTLDLNNYNKEDLLLMNSKMRSNGYGRTEKQTFEIEHTLSDSEKIKFVDMMTDGSATALINLLLKFVEDYKTVIKVTKSENINQASLDAWLKKNDEKQLIYNSSVSNSLEIRNSKENIEYWHYEISTRNAENVLICPNNRYGNYVWSGSHIVNQIFHNLLVKLRDEEIIYFRSIDQTYTTFNKLKEIASSRTVFESERLNFLLWNGIEKAKDRYEITVEDMLNWINAYEALDVYIKNFSVELQ